MPVLLNQHSTGLFCQLHDSRKNPIAQKTVSSQGILNSKRRTWQQTLKVIYRAQTYKSFLA